MRLVAALTFACVLALPGVSRAQTCPFPAFPAGCCDGDILKTCFGTDASGTDCATFGAGWGCVWSQGDGRYMCGEKAQNAFSDPGGTPRTCPACTAQCTGKECGADGCGESCGECTAAGFCNEAGQCECTPDCTGKACGDDGCGGSCGSCNPGFRCNTSFGSCEACTANCTGRLCGSDGCGGSCGTCFAGDLCNESSGQCEACTPQCAGKVCGPDGCGQSCGNCPDFGTCNASGQCDACVPQCSGRECGPDGCGGSCGTCDSGGICADGACQSCAPACEGRTCGDDGCGGTCGTCTGGLTCSSNGTCGDASACTNPLIATGCCDGTVFKTCGSGVLESTDCSALGQSCRQTGFGSVGCLPTGEGFTGPTCPVPCTPDCEGKECGDDGCGGTCGFCAQFGTLAACENDQCVCRPACGGRQCGDNGCGGSCGSCRANEDCVGARCVCRPSCDGKTCGDNGCGGTCGRCARGSTCTATGQCCTPNCQGKKCGDDGCGGSCGGCGPGEVCDPEDGQCSYESCEDIPVEGCCNGDIVRRCFSSRDSTGRLKVSRVSTNCRTEVPTFGGGRQAICAWSTSNRTYGCQNPIELSTTTSDPSGKVPRACGAEIVCVPKCTGKECGPDGCGGTCGTCDAGEKCNETTGACLPDPCVGIPEAGCCQGPRAIRCEQGKPVATFCGSRRVQDICGWNADSSTYQCGQSGSRDWSGANPRACPESVCVPYCTGRSCGDDGCGGSCGTCSTGLVCSQSGQCTPPCVPQCTNKQCGGDGCGGTCGTCGEGDTCTGSGQCVPVDRCNGIPEYGCCDGRTLKTCAYPSVPVSDDCAAAGLFCGFDGATGKYTCNEGGRESFTSGKPFACPGTPACVPQCTGKECGPDGCGGTCGTCTGSEECTASGQCQLACGGVAPLTGCCVNGNTWRWCPSMESSAYDIQESTCRGQEKCHYTWGASGLQDGRACQNYPHGPTWPIPPVCPPLPPSCDCKTPYGQPITCGQDDCGNNCGTCGAGEACLGGSCKLCTPNCRGRVCGSDGCGGSCGSCQGTQSCSAAGQCQNACDLPYTARGDCDQNTLRYCSTFGPQDYDCTSDGRVCGEFDRTVFGLGARCLGTGRRCTAETCGQNTTGATCQCDVACLERGDCCENFEGTCGPQLFSGTCGDGTCQPLAGETCTTCADDCTGCVTESREPGGPPWNLPYAQRLANRGTPAAREATIVPPADDVRPAPAPVPTDGLLAWVPEMNVNVGSPRTSTSDWTASDWDETDGTVASRFKPRAITQGRRGPGISFSVEDAATNAETARDSNRGLIRVMPERPTPGSYRPTEGSGNGATVAFWTRVPARSRKEENPLVAALAFAGGRELCMWNRPGETSLPMRCPGGQRLVAVEAYYGEVLNPPMPSDGWNIGEPSTEQCEWFRTLKPTGRCFAPGATSEVQDRCLTRNTCQVDVRAKTGDPCAESPTDTQQRSTLLVRGICEPDHPAFATLMVDAGNDGRLRLSVEGQGDVVSKDPVPNDKWVHVALTYAPREAGRGEVTLYLDGVETARREDMWWSPTYTWDFGAGYIRDPNARTDPMDPRRSPVLNRPRNRTADADIDELFLYDRPLRLAEIRRLYAMPEEGPLRVWPSEDARRATTRGMWTKGAVRATDITLPHLRDPGRSKPGSNVPATATFQAITVPADGAFTVTDLGKDIVELSRFTLAGWVKVDALTPPKTLFEIGTAESLYTLSTAAACGGGALRATLGSGSIEGDNCAHGLAPGRWSFVALVQDTNSRTLYVDGHRQKVATGNLPLFGGPPASTRRFKVAPGVSLGWMALFPRPVAPAELESMRSTGPSVWIDGVDFVRDGNRVPRDYANFQLFPSATVTNPVSLVGNTGRALTISDSGKLPMGTAIVKVPATTRFPAPNNTSARSFTWSGSVRIPDSGGSGATNVMIVPLFTQVDTDRQVSRGVLRCEVKQPPLQARTLNCRVDIEGLSTASDARDTYRTWSSATLSVPQRNAVVAEVAVAYDDPPRVALDFRSAAESADRTPLRVTPPGRFPEVTRTGASTTRPTTRFPAAPTGQWFLLPDGSGTGTRDVTYGDIRLYTRALAIGEMHELVVRDCEELACGDQNRLCITGTRLGTTDAGTCGPCRDGFAEFGGACVERRTFSEGCTADLDCLSGLCSGGVCVARTETDACKTECALLGRTCTKLAGEPERWGCSNTCSDNFAAVNGRCEWRPSKGDGEDCTNDLECRSGACATVTESRYGVSTNAIQIDKLSASSLGLNYVCSQVVGCAKAADTTVTRRVCAHEDANECKPANMHAEAIRTRLPLTDRVETRYSCNGCSQEMFAGRRKYTERWSMLSSAACEAVYTNYWARRMGLRGNPSAGWSSQLETPFSMSNYRQYVLGDDKPDSALTPAAFSKLQQDGVGPVLTGWSRLPYEVRLQYTSFDGVLGESDGRWPSLADCNRRAWRDMSDRHNRPTLRVSAFVQPQLNFPICVANKFPNGTQCPTPGINPPLDRARAGNTCLSGFCAHDTEVCEEGYRTYEDTEGSDRADADRGGGGNDMGPISFTQTNQALMAGGPVRGQSGDDARYYSLAVTNAYSLSMFGFAKYDLFDAGVTISTQMGAEKASRSERLKVFGLSIPFSRQANASKCGGVEWQDGEWKKTGCAAARQASGIVDPSNTPQVTFAVPIPIGGCKKKDKNPLSGQEIETGKLCYKLTTFIGPVPTVIEIGVALSAGISYGATIDGDTMEPGFAITPAVGIGLEVKGGIGAAASAGGGLEFGISVGIKAAITLVEISFPIGWSLRFVQAQKTADGKTYAVPELWKLQYGRTVSMVVNFFKVFFGLYFEAKLGIDPFTISYEYGLFGLDGITLTKLLSSDVIQSKKLDFQWVAQ